MLADWALDAIQDSVKLLPVLFFVFVLIEILEFYFSDKINHLKKGGVIAGSLLSILPQCGFSVIAASLYSNKMITRGCLIAVFLATSDETIPILLANPEKAYLIIPIVGIKLFIAILMGYFIDLVSPKIIKPKEEITIEEEGCCNHSPQTHNKRELIIHPIMHTINIFAFILVITLILNYTLEYFELDKILLNSNQYLQCIAASIVGLIPNCAVSVVITMMLIKGTISFGAAMSGLLSNAGLGLLVLLKRNDLKDTFGIIFILTAISIVSGLTINFL